MLPSTFFSPLFEAASRMDCPPDHKKKRKKLVDTSLWLVKPKWLQGLIGIKLALDFTSGRPLF
jgi:hypothetical protein